MNFFIRLVINALALLLAARIIPGITVSGFAAALFAAFLFGLLNSTLGSLIKLLTLPLSLLTLGLFFLVINGLVLMLAGLAPGFEVTGFTAAFLGALLLSAASLAGRRLTR